MTSGWNPPLSDFKPVPLPLGAATPAIYPAVANNDTLVDIAKKLERVIELLEQLTKTHGA